MDTISQKLSEKSQIIEEEYIKEKGTFLLAPKAKIMIDEFDKKVNEKDKVFKEIKQYEKCAKIANEYADELSNRTLLAVQQSAVAYIKNNDYESAYDVLDLEEIASDIDEIEEVYKSFVNFENLLSAFELQKEYNKNDPKINFDLFLVAIKCYYEIGDYDTAQKLISVVEKNNSNFITDYEQDFDNTLKNFFHYSALVCAKLSDYAKAEAYCKGAIEKFKYSYEDKETNRINELLGTDNGYITLEETEEEIMWYMEYIKIFLKNGNNAYCVELLDYCIKCLEKKNLQYIPMLANTVKTIHITAMKIFNELSASEKNSPDFIEFLEKVNSFNKTVLVGYTRYSKPILSSTTDNLKNVISTF